MACHGIRRLAPGSLGLKAHSSASAVKMTYEIEPLENGAKVFWVNSRSPASEHVDKVLLYIHGELYNTTSRVVLTI